LNLYNNTIINCLRSGQTTADSVAESSIAFCVMLALTSNMVYMHCCSRKWWRTQM